MIIWLNGTFGAGKTTVASRLLELTSGYRIFDPEYVGYLLVNALPDHEFSDFQQLPPWRTLVPHVADEVARFTGQQLIAPQTVLERGFWEEIVDGLVRRGHDVRHVVLDADASTLHARIDADEDGHDIQRWRHDHVDPYLAARSWLFDSADLVVDTATLGPEAAAAEILRSVHAAAPRQLRENAGSETRETCVFPQFAGEGEAGGVSS